MNPTTNAFGPWAMLRRFWPLVALIVAAAALWPAAAHGQSHTFLNTQGFAPEEDGGTSGPANNYPGTVSVSGLGGTVTKVTLTVIDLSASNLDMALVGPNGAAVMLMSDACSSVAAGDEFWTFDDAASVFVNSGSCPSGQRSSVLPTNYGDPEDDDLSVKGGPAGPFTNSLAAFNGISPDGDWKLFMFDDTVGGVGFLMPAFALHLEVEPPPSPAPTIVTVEVPVQAQATGKRAKALAKCKKKPTAAAKKRCRANAKKLPV